MIHVNIVRPIPDDQLRKHYHGQIIWKYEMIPEITKRR